MFNQKQMEKAMKRMGIRSEEVNADEVIIKCKDMDIIITNPSVSKVCMGNQETFQVMGTVAKSLKEKFSDEDLELIKEQTGCTEEEARLVLDETGDIAEAILKLKK